MFYEEKVTNIENETLTNCQLGELDLEGTTLDRPVSYIYLLHQHRLISISPEEWRKMWLQDFDIYCYIYVLIIFFFSIFEEGYEYCSVWENTYYFQFFKF